jgi:hypothetical protein
VELVRLATSAFRNVHLTTTTHAIEAKYSKKGKCLLRQTQLETADAPVTVSGIGDHNRTRNHLIQDGVVCPFLVETGVMSASGKVHASHSKKFKQINRFLEFYVLESKSYSSGVQINDQGEFSIWVGRRSVGIASPIEQNQRHISVLRDLLDALPMPSRLGIRLNPSLQSYVLVSERATIKRPAERLAEYSSIIKADMLATKIDREVDEAGALKALSSVAKMVSSESIESIGRLLVMEHKPQAVNYVAKFGLEEESIPQAVVDTVHEPAPPPLEAPVCEKCGSAMVARVAKRGENAGNEFWGCSRFPACRFVRAT